MDVSLIGILLNSDMGEWMSRNRKGGARKGIKLYTFHFDLHIYQFTFLLTPLTIIMIKFFLCTSPYISNRYNKHSIPLFALPLYSYLLCQSLGRLSPAKGKSEVSTLS